MKYEDFVFIPAKSLVSCESLSKDNPFAFSVFFFFFPCSSAQLLPLSSLILIFLALSSSTRCVFAVSPNILLFLHLIAAALTQPKHIAVLSQVCPQIQVSLLPGKAASGLFRGSFLIFSITGRATGGSGLSTQSMNFKSVQMLLVCTHPPIHPWANYLPFHYPSIHIPNSRASSSFDAHPW